MSASNGWKPGQSGNPKGRPAGTGEVAKLREMISPHMPEIVQQIVQKAREGDMQAARLLVERVLPPIKAIENAVEIDLPLEGDFEEQARAILRAVSQAQIAPGQGSALLAALGSVAKLKEVDDLVKRIEALELAKEGK